MGAKMKLITVIVLVAAFTFVAIIGCFAVLSFIEADIKDAALQTKFELETGKIKAEFETEKAKAYKELEIARQQLRTLRFHLFLKTMMLSFTVMFLIALIIFFVKYFASLAKIERSKKSQDGDILEIDGGGE